MKIASRQISAFLSGQIKTCKGVLIYGADEGQVREHAGSVQKAFGVDAKDPFAYTELGEDQLKAQPTLLYDELFAISMMGGQRFVCLQTGSDATGRELEEIFYDKQKQPDNFLLILAGELSARSTLRILFENHPQLAAIPCYKDEAQNIGVLVQQTLTQAKIQASRDVVDYLRENLGADRYVTRSELEKIALYCGEGGQLSLEDARALVGNSTDTGLDDLCNALADGHIRQTETVLQKLLREAVQPIQMIRALQRHFLRLHLLASQIAQDRIPVSQAVANAKPKVFFKQVPIMERQLTQWKLTMVEQALLLLTAAERASKETGSAPEAQLQHYATEILALFHKSRRTA